MPFPTGGHFGRDKTIEKVCSRVYLGKNMTAEVKEYVRTCDVCQRVNDKFQKPPAELHPIPVSPEVWKQVTFWCRPYIFYYAGVHSLPFATLTCSTRMGQMTVPCLLLLLLRPCVQAKIHIC